MTDPSTTFLIVDELETMRRVTAGQLRSLGWEKVHTASNGADALRLLGKQKIDVILSDWDMPVISGMDLLKSVRASEHHFHLPFVVITADAERKRVEQAISFGVSNLLIKPYTAERLLTTINKALSWVPARRTAEGALLQPAGPAEAATAKATPATAPTVLPTETQPLPIPTILIVDDTPENLHLLTDLFNEEYKVRVSNNGQRALDICCSNNPPDLVLLDVMMPDIDGFEVARRMRKHPDASNIPIIFVTAMDAHDAHMEGLSLGAVDYVTKPIQPEVLVPRVRNFLRYVESHRQLQADFDHMVENARLKEHVEQITRDDMKGPLAGVIGLIQGLVDSDELGRRGREQLRLAEESALHLLNMINLSTELYKIETGVFKLQPAAVEIGQLLRRMVEMLRGTFAAKNLTIAVDVDGPVGEDMPKALGDATLCYSLFYNLLKNACEASPDKGRVAVVLYPKDVLRITIENQGAVPAQIRKRFFEKFVSSGKGAGAGLGTYSAKMLAQAQGGQIELRVFDESNTTLVTVSLPRAGQ